MPALYERQMGEKLFHGDETRWEVFEEVEGKTGHRWYLWVMQSASVVFYRMAPGRGADVPKAHFAKLHKDLVEVVLVCDRYSAYKCLAKDCDDLHLGLLLGACASGFSQGGAQLAGARELDVRLGRRYRCTLPPQ